MTHILYVAAEGLPFVKTGGLADVIGSLPQAMANEKFKVSVVMPLYLKIARNEHSTLTRIKTFPIEVGDYNTVATVYSRVEGDVTYYLIEHAGYFERDGYYGYADDGERFAYFTHAVLRMIEEKIVEPDVLHSHDWHAGFISLLMKTVYVDRVKQMFTIFTIHNLLYQGVFPYEMLGSCLGLGNDWYFDGRLRFKHGISFMKAGIAYSDIVTTVSETYSKEILTPFFGEGMEDVLRLREYDLYGIVNGIDMDAWDPSVDDTLTEKYSLKNVDEGKLENKLKLQEDLGLRVDKNVMLVGMVSRLTNQKGIGLILEAMNDIMGWDIQLVILGTGDQWAEEALRSIEFKYPRRAVYYCGYNEALAHRIYAASDVFLMPSIFEPCGISQMIAMRYGALPVVRETGGLKDTVTPFNEFTDEGEGFSFGPADVNVFKQVLWYAWDVFTYRKEKLAVLRKNAMTKDVSWTKSAKAYGDLINTKLKERADAEKKAKAEAKKLAEEAKKAATKKKAPAKKTTKSTAAKKPATKKAAPKKTAAKK